MSALFLTERGSFSFKLITEELQDEFLDHVVQSYELAVVNPKWSEKKGDITALPTFPDAMTLQWPLAYFYLLSVMKREVTDLEIMERLLSGKPYFIFQTEMKDVLYKYSAEEFREYREMFMEDIITALNHLHLSYVLPYREGSSYNSVAPLIKNYYHNVPIVEVW